jgi:hypothetical protein
MPRSISPYIQILDDFLEDRIDVLSFRTRTIRQYDKIDARVDWTREWGEDVEAVLDQMDGDAEVYYPEAPEESHISLAELRRSSRENLRRLRAAVERRRG